MLRSLQLHDTQGFCACVYRYGKLCVNVIELLERNSYAAKGFSVKEK